MDSELLNLNNKKKKKKCSNETIRLEVDLFTPTKDKCPEFDFCELVKEKTGKTINQDPLDESEEVQKLKQIAKKFEEKYGSSTKGKHGKKYSFGKPEDYLDLGMGYDKTDPFIDDTEEYDELIPSTMTTKLGGFYVNEGEIEYKYIDDSSGDSGDDDSSDSEPEAKKGRVKEKKATLNKPISSAHSDSKNKRSTIPNLVNKRRKMDKRNGIQKKSLTPNQKAGSALVKNSRNILARKLKKSNGEMLTPTRAKRVDDVVSLVATGVSSAPCRPPSVNVDTTIESTITEMLNDSVSKRRIAKSEKDFNFLLDVSRSDSESEEAMQQLVNLEAEQEKEHTSSEESPVRLVGRPPTLQSSKKQPKKSPFSIPPDIQRLLEKICQETFTDANGKCKLTSTWDKILQEIFALIDRYEFNQLQRTIVISDVSNRTGLSKTVLLNRQKRLSSENIQKSEIMKKANSFNLLLSQLEQEVRKVMPGLEAEHAQALKLSAEKKLEISYLSEIGHLCHKKYFKTHPSAPLEAFEKFTCESIVPKILHCFPPNWMTGKPIMKMFREVCPSIFPKQDTSVSATPLSSPIIATAPSADSSSAMDVSISSPHIKTKTDFTIDCVLSAKTTSTPPLSSSRDSPCVIASNRSTHSRSKSDDLPLDIDLQTPPPIRSDAVVVSRQNQPPLTTTPDVAVATVVKATPVVTVTSNRVTMAVSNEASSNSVIPAVIAEPTAKVQHKSVSKQTASKPTVEKTKTVTTAPPMNVFTQNFMEQFNISPVQQQQQLQLTVDKAGKISKLNFERLRDAVAVATASAPVTVVDERVPTVRKPSSKATAAPGGDRLASAQTVCQPSPTLNRDKLQTTLSQSLPLLNRDQKLSHSTGVASNEQHFKSPQTKTSKNVSTAPSTYSPAATVSSVSQQRTISSTKSATAAPPVAATAASRAVKSEMIELTDQQHPSVAPKKLQQQPPIPKLTSPNLKMHDHSAFKSPLVSPASSSAVNLAKIISPYESPNVQQQQQLKQKASKPVLVAQPGASTSYPGSVAMQRMASSVATEYRKTDVTTTVAPFATSVLSLSPVKQQQTPKMSPPASSYAAYGQLTPEQYYNSVRATQANQYYPQDYFLPATSSYSPPRDFPSQFSSPLNYGRQESAVQQQLQYSSAFLQGQSRMSPINQSSRDRSASSALYGQQQNQGYTRMTINLPPNNLHNP